MTHKILTLTFNWPLLKIAKHFEFFNIFDLIRATFQSLFIQEYFVLNIRSWYQQLARICETHVFNRPLSKVTKYLDHREMELSYQESSCFNLFWMYNKIITIYVHLLWHVKFILLISGATDIKGFKNILILKIYCEILSGQCFEYICIQLICMFISCVAVLIVFKFSILSI